MIDRIFFKNHFLVLPIMKLKIRDNDIPNGCQRDPPKDLDGNGIQEHIGQTSLTEGAVSQCGWAEKQPQTD